MARIIVADVKEILDDTTLTDPTINAYITGANTLINSVLGTGSSDILKEIERWMTAHMIACTRERMAKKEGAGGASIEYIGEYKDKLSSTPYGQMVLTLDTTGLMASLGNRAVSITAIKSFDKDSDKYEYRGL